MLNKLLLLFYVFDLTNLPKHFWFLFEQNAIDLITNTYILTNFYLIFKFKSRLLYVLIGIGKENVNFITRRSPLKTTNSLFSFLFIHLPILWARIKLFTQHLCAFKWLFIIIITFCFFFWTCRAKWLYLI